MFYTQTYLFSELFPLSNKKERSHFFDNKIHIYNYDVSFLIKKKRATFLSTSLFAQKLLNRL